MIMIRFHFTHLGQVLHFCLCVFAPQIDSSDSVAGAQNFFQSFAPLFQASPLGHSRPIIFTDNAAYKPAFKALRESDRAILGSGNFGVVKGGTYYAEADGEAAPASIAEATSWGNGHGRPPAHVKNPAPAFKNGGDFFAHFRDFADITAPNKAFSDQFEHVAAYAEDHHVYAKSNNADRDDDAAPATASNIGTSTPSDFKPKNIIEQLAMMDVLSYEKTSKIKEKLMKHKKKAEAKEKAAKAKLFSPPKELPEPLMATS